MFSTVSTYKFVFSIFIGVFSVDRTQTEYLHKKKTQKKTDRKQKLSGKFYNIPSVNVCEII